MATIRSGLATFFPTPKTAYRLSCLNVLLASGRRLSSDYSLRRALAAALRARTRSGGLPCTLPPTPRPSDVRPLRGHGPLSGGFLESRVYSLDLSQALLKSTHPFRDLAQLLREYHVVIQVWKDDPTGVKPIVNSARTDGRETQHSERISSLRWMCAWLSLKPSRLHTSSSTVAPT